MKALRPVMLAATAAAVLGLSPAKAADNPESLIELWKSANTLCRGGSGDDPQTMKACDIREDYQARLGRLGWCYGENSKHGYQDAWARCRH